MRLIDADKLNRKDVNCANVPMNFIDTAPTVEAILKADMVAILEAIKDELKHTNLSGVWKPNYKEGFNDSVAISVKKIQCRIDQLKEVINHVD